MTSSKLGETIKKVGLDNIVIIQYCIISYHIISYHIISYHIISYHIISYYIHIILMKKIFDEKYLRNVFLPCKFQKKNTGLIKAA